MSTVTEAPRELGRYDLFDQIAAGGMATVHFGRMHGAVGFQRVVAIKRLHAHYAHDAHFVEMFLDEARLASRLKHPNVISTVDVVAEGTEVFLVMEFVLGESLEALMPRPNSRAIPLAIVASVMCDVLEGLHGAHEAVSDTGEALGIVHRDVSPHNVIVGDDGVSRVFDFGIAKAAINTQETRDGVVKGKVTYMAPEQVRGGADRRADIYAAGVIFWELIVGRRRHAGERSDTLFLKLATNSLADLPAASELRLDVPEALDAIIARATAKDPDERYATAREMAVAIEAVIRPAMARDVAEWVRDVAGPRINQLADVMKRIEAEIGPRSEPSIPVDRIARSSTSSGRVATGSLTRAGGVASSVPPYETDAGRVAVAGAEADALRASARPSRMSGASLAVLAFVAALLGVGLYVVTSGQTVPAAAPARAASVQVERTPEVPVVATGAATVVTTAAPVVSASASASASPSATAVTKATATARPVQAWSPPQRAVHVAPPPVSAPASAATTPPASAPAAAAPAGNKPGCESPFVVGRDGIRQIKPECM